MHRLTLAFCICFLCIACGTNTKPQQTTIEDQIVNIEKPMTLYIF